MRTFALQMVMKLRSTHCTSWQVLPLFQVRTDTVCKSNVHVDPCTFSDACFHTIHSSCACTCSE